MKAFLEGLKQKGLPYLRENKGNLILAVIPILVAVILFFTQFWPHYTQLKREREVLRQKQRLVKEYKRKLDELSKQKKAPQKEVLKYLFTGKDPYVVVSSLQNALKDIQGINIRSFRIISQKDFIGNVKKIVVNFSIQGDVRSLVEMLEILTNYEKALKIQQLIVSRLTRGKRQFLQINLRLEGLFRPLHEKSPAK